MEDIDTFCSTLYKNGWWKSKTLGDLVNHEIMHARINNNNSYRKIEALYEYLRDDQRVKGFCRFVDRYPDEFLNEVYVALINGEDISEQYIEVYNEYIREYLGGY